jgi:hypothetical protein
MAGSNPTTALESIARLAQSFLPSSRANETKVDREILILIREMNEIKEWQKEVKAAAIKYESLEKQIVHIKHKIIKLQALKKKEKWE